MILPFLLSVETRVLQMLTNAAANEATEFLGSIDP